MRGFAVVCCVFGLSLVLPDSAGSPTPIESIESKTLYVCSFEQNSSLYRLNSDNGSATLVGEMGIGCTDLAYSKTLFVGITFTDFFTVNPRTGTVSGVRSHGFFDLNALVAADRASPSLFYAAGNQDSFGRGSLFVLIDATSGTASRIGTFGNGLTSAGDLAFCNEVLYATVLKPGSPNTWLAKINVANGRATLVGDIGYDNVWGLEAESGGLYGTTGDGEVLRIDVANGAGILIGRNGLAQAGLAKSP